MPIYQVPGPHQGALAELAEVVRYGLAALKLKHEPMIVLGAHTLQGDPLSTLLDGPTEIIIYNTEHPSSPFMTPQYKRLLEEYPVWSYHPDGPGKFVPIGYMPQMTRIPKPQLQPVDVLFYGSLNERRTRKLHDLLDAGLKVKVLRLGTYGAERDEWIANSKIVLNVHYYTPGIMEIVRLSYLWANRKCVVTESTDKTAGFHYDDLVDACVEFVKDESMRVQAEDRCFRVVKRLTMDVILKAALR
jgi:hypothetical protein